MTIRYQPVDKQYILRCLNPKYGKRKHHKSTQFFKYFNVSRRSDYFEFGILHTIRPEISVLNGYMIDNIQKKYVFCSVGREQFGDALYVICKRDRWNECDNCGKILWEDKGDESYDYNEINSYKDKSLCNKCYKQVKKNE